MTCIDPQKTDTDEFQQIQPIGFMGEHKNLSENAMLNAQ
jgi:hypothetical protein